MLLFLTCQQGMELQLQACGTLWSVCRKVAPKAEVAPVLRAGGSRVHVLGQLYTSLQKQVQKPHDAEHLALTTYSHRADTQGFHFLSSQTVLRNLRSRFLAFIRAQLQEAGISLHLPIFSGLRHASFLLRSRVSNVSS